MNKSSLTLYLEINDLNYIFYVGENDEQNNFKITYKLNIPLKGLEIIGISDLEKAFNIIKENIYLIEQKFNHTFKEIVLILDTLKLTFINLSGFRKLNGSQILRENVTYILNTLKSCVDNIELKKTILHIFNSKFYLDNKKIENLPIGLFGDFYSHELAFTLINKNDYKNLKGIFDKSGLNIKKILIKSFIKGAYISNNFKNKDTFFQITISENNSKIFYFENDSLKSEHKFNFGTDIVIKDISKITSLKIENIKSILKKTEFINGGNVDEIVEKEHFNEKNFRIIKKKLIYDIAYARIKEISELLVFKNINYKHYNKSKTSIFLDVENRMQYKFLNEIYKNIFSLNGNLNFIFIDKLSSEIILNSANKLVHFGWKKEVIPVTHTKKSLIVRFFETIFG